MTGGAAHRRTRGAALAVAAAATACLLPAAPAAALNRYQLQGGCYTLTTAGGSPVTRIGNTYGFGGTPAVFRMQATALGRYLLYDSTGSMPAVGADGVIRATRQPGPDADFSVSLSGPGGLKLRTYVGRRPVASTDTGLEVAATPERFGFTKAGGCARFPEMTTDATGTPFRGTTRDGRVRGFIDDHIHLMAFEFMGGYFHCGRPWSPYGVTVALADCRSGEPALSAIGDNVLAGRAIGAELQGGWPDFRDWPRRDSVLREATYWKSLERAWLGGVRIMVNELVQNDALCEIWPVKRTPCDDMSTVRLQYADTLALQDYIDAQYGGPGKGFFRVVRSPAAARKVIADGKLAIVNSVETSAVFGCGQYQGAPRCTKADIDRGMDEFQRMGIASFFPVHKFDNALGGAHFDQGTTGLLVSIGQNWTSGQWWAPQPCDPGDPDHDNTPSGIFGQDVYTLLSFLGIPGGTLPAYPSAPVCNPKGLTDLGTYVIEQMVRRGFVIETDHLSVKARRQALDIIERTRYPGLISSHSWGDEGSTRRLQALGGFVGPIVGGGSPGANDLWGQWQRSRQNRAPQFFFGTGFASDIGGLARQYGPLPAGPYNQGATVQYPFTSFDGGVTFARHTIGTRTLDYNTEGVAEYGMYPDWLESMRLTGGQQIMDDLFNGSESYLQMWERARRAAGR